MESDNNYSMTPSNLLAVASRPGVPHIRIACRPARWRSIDNYDMNFVCRFQSHDILLPVTRQRSEVMFSGAIALLPLIFVIPVISVAHLIEITLGNWTVLGDLPSITIILRQRLIPRLHYQPVSSRFSSCALTSPVSTYVCVYITTARTGLNQRQLVRLFHSTVAGSRAVPKHVRACR